MEIRESGITDVATILEIHEEAFGATEGQAVSQLVDELLAEHPAQPIKSFVALRNEEILGNIIFSPVEISGHEGLLAYILAPLAVRRNCQGKGVGLALIQYGLRAMKKQGVQIVMVLGDPKYYSKSGFESGHNIMPPYKLDYPEAWMAQELSPGILDRVSGVIRCVPPLNAPEHW